MGQDIFERKIDQTYENCKGAVGIADDVRYLAIRKLMTVCSRRLKNA